MTDGIKKEHQKKKSNQEKLVNVLTTVIEKMNYLIVDLKRDTFDFKKEVILNGKNQKTGQTVSKKIMQYYEVKELKRTTLAENLCFNNLSLAVHIRKKEEI